MNAAHLGKGIQVLEHEIEFVRQIRGVQVRDLMTKFFYKNNQLCFQIILHLEGDEAVVFKEFSDYGNYKRTMDSLQAAKANSSIIKIPKKNGMNGTLSPKVA